MNDQGRGTTVGRERKADVTSPVAEIVMMTITGKEAVSERDIVIATEIATENVTENGSIVIVKEGGHVSFMLYKYMVSLINSSKFWQWIIYMVNVYILNAPAVCTESFLLVASEANFGK